MARKRASPVHIYGILFLTALAIWAAQRLVQRWQEETRDRELVLAVDWSEIRDAALRQGISDRQLLERLKRAGATSIVVGSATLEDYRAQGFGFSSRTAAEAVRLQLENRGVTGLSVRRRGPVYALEGLGSRSEGLMDVEAGFDGALLSLIQQTGLSVILRINQDPWLTPDTLMGEMDQLGRAVKPLGLFFNTDEIPGGRESLPHWAHWVQSEKTSVLLFEFHPAKASLRLAAAVPEWTYRAHTIPSNELSSLSPAQILARWRRAVQERSCRFLLLHLSPMDSLSSFLENIVTLRQELARNGWQIGWPAARRWSGENRYAGVTRLGALCALLMAIVFPVMALRLGVRAKNPWLSLAVTAIVTLAGASAMAAMADNPLTRVQVVPFHGIKLAFIAAWAGSWITLYSWTECRDQLRKPVLRRDLVLGGILILGLGYLLIRTGNAGAGWKSGWEQKTREALEEFLVARPRFKEFAIGYPLLLLGFYVRRRGASSFTGGLAKRLEHWNLGDGRILIGAGMIGPITTFNTFCHLHSPLYLAYWRSVNGIVLGTIIGSLAVGLARGRHLRI